MWKWKSDIWTFELELFNSLPCSDSKSHSLQEKSSLTLSSRLTKYSKSLVDVASNSQSSQFICWLLMSTLKLSRCSHLQLHFHNSKFVRHQASSLSKYLANQNTFKKLLLSQIGKLLGTIFLTARLYWSSVTTIQFYSRNTDPILNLFINTYRTFFWMRFFLFPSFWNTHAVNTSLCA